MGTLTMKSTDYTIEDHDPNTEPVHHPENHFQDPIDALNDVRKATANCKKEDFERAMHRLQDNWTHYAKGFRSTWFHGWHPKHWIYGHGGALTFPDNDHAAWQVAAKVTQTRVIIWNQNCCQDKSGKWVKKSTGCCAK